MSPEGIEPSTYRLRVPRILCMGLRSSAFLRHSRDRLHRPARLRSRLAHRWLTSIEGFRLRVRGADRRRRLLMERRHEMPVELIRNADAAVAQQLLDRGQID